jgi:hypothetical protein
MLCVAVSGTAERLRQSAIRLLQAWNDALYEQALFSDSILLVEYSPELLAVFLGLLPLVLVRTLNFKGCQIFFFRSCFADPRSVSQWTLNVRLQSLQPSRPQHLVSV